MIILFLDFNIQFSFSAEKPQDPIQEKNDPDSVNKPVAEDEDANYDPSIEPIDSTAIAFLDDKVVPYQEAMKYCFEENKGKLKALFYPIDAIFNYGEKARNGLVLLESCKIESK